MIQNKRELCEYLDADMRMLGASRLKGVTGKYLLWLRRTEYHLNTSHHCRYKVSYTILKILSLLSGVCIPPNTFGKGLGLFHYGTIIVNPSARFGDYCGIQAGVNVAENITSRN